MKRKLLLKLAVTGALLMFFTTNGFSQNTVTQPVNLGIPEIALVNAADSLGNLGGTINLTLTTTTPGAPISGGQATSYLQVSSIIGSTASTISAAVTTGTVPAGTYLYLRGEVPGSSPNSTATDASGAYGTASAQVTLSSTSSTIFTAVGSCYTGTSQYDGYQLFWNWATNISNYGSIVGSPTATAIVVTFTITATP